GLLQKRAANRKLRAVNALVVKQNEKLTELNFEKNSLISIVSHDLGSPFAAIKMWGQVLSSANGNLNEDQHKALTRILDSTTRGEELIKSILDVEKAEFNQQPVYIGEIDIAKLVQSVVEDFEPAARQKSISLYAKLPSSPVLLLTDKHLVGRICENL